jgi:chemotaxis protein MotB
MALSRRRNDHMGANAWPGYVDVLSTLLMVIVFVLAVFMLVQFFLANAISGRDRAIEGLRSELAGLVEQLGLEKRNNAALRLPNATSWRPCSPTARPAPTMPRNGWPSSSRS